MSDWLSVLTDLRDSDTPCVLITVTEAKGSTPRESGTKMVVTADKQFGTIGGGNLEFEAIKEARKLLTAATSSIKTKDYPLGPALAQCCGGMVNGAAGAVRLAAQDGAAFRCGPCGARGGEGARRVTHPRKMDRRAAQMSFRRRSPRELRKDHHGKTSGKTE